MNIRHLHETGQTHTICGRGKTQCQSVHVSKARKSDCEKCRSGHRQIRCTTVTKVYQFVYRQTEYRSGVVKADSTQEAEEKIMLGDYCDSSFEGTEDREIVTLDEEHEEQED